MLSFLYASLLHSTKLSEGDIRYGAANYKVIGLNCVVGKHATFRLQPISRAKDVVIPITLKYGDQSRTFTYTILAEEVVSLPVAPVVAAQPVAPESTPVPLPGKSDLIMVVLGASVVLITVIIGISVFQKKRPSSREK